MTAATARVRVSLLRRLAAARARTDELFAMVSPDTLNERPIPERQNILFYLGHLEAKDWNLIGQRYLGLRTIEPTFELLFSCEGNGLNDQSPTGRSVDWPGAEQVTGYRQRVRESLDRRLEGSLDSAGNQAGASAHLLQAAIEHRLMHAETLAYMLHQLPSHRKSSREGCPAPNAQPATPRMVEIPAGTATLGLPRDEHSPFGWDNEFEELEVAVPSFQIDAYKVTNREFLHFLANGGYQERSLWTEEDWDWLQSSGISHPVFWTLQGSRLFLRTMFGEMPLPMDWPVYVSHAEASAYAHWAGKKLPSEAEWHRAAYGTPDTGEQPYPWGRSLPGAGHGNFDFYRWDAAPVRAFPTGASAWGVFDLAGNGWEWTRTSFRPFAGFEPLPFFPGYSAPAFEKRHYVLKGGSARTAACLLRRSFRNWGRPHERYLYAGFRCVVH